MIFSARWIRHLVPNIGTVILIAVMLFAYRASAASNDLAAPDAIPGTISYQGLLNNSAGQPVNGNTNITFRLYNTPTGSITSALWTEMHIGANAVPVYNGLFNVLLGSLTPIPTSVWSNASVYLGVQVDGDAEMTPRELVSSVPSAMTAPYGAIGTNQIADAAVTSEKAQLSKGRVSANQSIALSAITQDVPGLSVTVSPQTTQSYLVIVTADLEVQSGTAVAQLYVDNVPQPSQVDTRRCKRCNSRNDSSIVFGGLSPRYTHSQFASTA